LELLIAATILGLLAVVATVSFKNASADSHMAAARVKTNELMTALQQFRINHTLRVAGTLLDLPGSGPYACSYDLSNNEYQPTVLISCGYLDNGGWSGDIQYEVCKANSVFCAGSNGSPINNPWVCMAGRDNSRLPDKYKWSKGYLYCANQTTAKEKLGGQ
jgi:Tfp pilus assembly protein PilE